MVKKDFTAHGIDFERTGDCNQCGGCDHECSVCPHGELKKNKWNCKIRVPDTRGAICEYCTNNKDSSWYRGGKDVVHQICIDFPNHPWLGVIRSEQCAYKFIKKDGGSLDSLPFTNGKFLKED